jgi:hypothetical protein
MPKPTTTVKNTTVKTSSTGKDKSAEPKKVTIMTPKKTEKTEKSEKTTTTKTTTPKTVSVKSRQSKQTGKNVPSGVSTKKVMTFVQDFLTKNNCVDKLEEWNNTQDSLNNLMQNILKDNKTKQKKLKDPNMPKRPLTAYMYFCEANRKKLQEKHPDKKVTEIVVLLSDAWKKVKDKKPYEKKAEEAKVAYTEAMKNFVPTQGYEKTFKKVKDPNAPKRPPSAYLIFSMEKRKEGLSGDVNGKDIMKKIGLMWKELPDTQKKQYEEKSQQMKEEYLKTKEVAVKA